MTVVGGNYDAAIIGAGIMGATTALFLTQGGMRCALIDRRGICGEASGVNAGTLTLHMTRATLIPYALKSWEMWTSTQNWLGYDPGVTASEGLCLAFTEAEAELLQQRSQARTDMGAPIEIVGSDRAREIEPGLSERVLLAALCPIDGHVTANFTGQAYQQALAKAEIDLYTDTAVSKVDVTDSSFEIRSLDKKIHARRLILAGGVWLEEMLSWLGVTLPIKTLINQLIITERLRPVMRTVLSVANGLLSLKQFANGTVLIGGGWQGKGNRQSHETEFIPDNLIGNVRLAQFAVPALAETRVVRAWLGFEAETADAMPLLGPVPNLENAFLIGSVHSGYTSGPYMAKLLAQLILGQQPELPLFDPARLLESNAI